MLDFKYNLFIIPNFTNIISLVVASLYTRHPKYIHICTQINNFTILYDQFKKSLDYINCLVDTQVNIFIKLHDQLNNVLDYINCLVVNFRCVKFN